MSDLIDRNKLLEEIKDYQMDIVSKATAMTVIRNAPTVEAKPVVRGEWMKKVRNNGGYVASITCSACGYAHSRVTYNFCPECGADMRKGGASNV